MTTQRVGRALLAAAALYLGACSAAPPSVPPLGTASPGTPAPTAEATTPLDTPPATTSPAPTASASADAPWIVYQAVFAGGTNLGLIRSDGTDDHPIPGGPANRWHPNWSPDGTRIVYDWNTPDDTAEIAFLSLDGSEEERSLLSCIAPCLGHGGPAWSPDGATIGFDGAESSTAEHEGDLCYLARLDLASGSVARFLEHADCELADSYLQFSPDGQRVVFQRLGPEGQAIFSATIDGEDERQLTGWGAWARADWSPDGRWIVFQDREPESHPGEVISLYRVRSDGTGMARLTDPGQGYFDVYPRYLPDGNAILFSRCREAEPCETRLIDPDGRSDRILIPAFRFDVVHVVWQPSP
jgi:Tol biopolymer transport system component